MIRVVNKRTACKLSITESGKFATEYCSSENQWLSFVENMNIWRKQDEKDAIIRLNCTSYFSISLSEHF